MFAVGLFDLVIVFAGFILLFMLCVVVLRDLLCGLGLGVVCVLVVYSLILFNCCNGLLLLVLITWDLFLICLYFNSSCIHYRFWFSCLLLS